jgi:hypothetical protein
MDIKTQSYYARLTGSFMREPLMMEAPVAGIMTQLVRYMATEISLHGKHGKKEWMLLITSELIHTLETEESKRQEAMRSLNDQAMALFADDIPDDSPLPNETENEYYERRRKDFGETHGVAHYMTNLHFNPTANDEMNRFRADPSAIRFLELDSGQGKDELAEEYGTLRNTLKLKYPGVWPLLNLRRS